HSGDSDLHRSFGEDERVALRQHAAPGLEIEHSDLARIIAGEAYLPLAVAMKVRQKQRFAHHGAPKSAKDLIADGTAAHTRFPTHVGGLVHPLAGFGEDLLAWLELDPRDLQVITLNAVFKRPRRRGRRVGLSHRPAAVGTKAGVLSNVRTAVLAKSHVPPFNNPNRSMIVAAQ